MRTTVRLPDELLAEAKRVASEEGTTLTALLEEGLRTALHRRCRPETQEPVRLPTFRGDGVQPGVDLDDTAALLDLMESADDPR